MLAAISPGDALNLDVTDRRRLAIAAAFTLVALPAIWLFTRGEGSSASTIGAAGIAQPQGGNGAGAPTAGTSDVFGSNSPIFIDGPTTPPKPAVIQIVVPAEVKGRFKEGGATYKAVVGNQPDSCDAPNAPFGATLTVTNRDNGFAVQCINLAPTGLPPGIEVVLTTQQFIAIGQLVDAPVPVRITWGNG